MKSVILVYLLNILYHPSLCDYQQLFEIVEREHPKKANLVSDFRHLQYLNPVKVITRIPNYRRFGAPGNAYTLYPPVEGRRVGVPDSPYFPLEKNMEVRSRVKKIMADSVPRYKRSAEETVSFTNPGAENVSKNVAKQSTNHNDASVIVQRSKNKRAKKQKRQKRKGKNSKKSSKNVTNKPQGNKKPSKEQKSARRIISGRDAHIDKYPYVISIQKYGRHWCSGALLNPVLFISTANCFWKSEHMTRMTVRAGSSYVDRGGYVAKIQEIIKHPKWSVRDIPECDVALGLISKVLRFTDDMHSVDLPNHAMKPAFNDLLVTSWGASRQDGMYEVGKGQVLQVYRANQMKIDECREILVKFMVNVSSNFVCLEQTGHTSPCTADTGAPAVNDGVLWGLASWGIRTRCGSERYPSVFTYIGSNANLFFITEAINYLMSDPRVYPYLDRVRGVTEAAGPNLLQRMHNETEPVEQNTESMGAFDPIGS